MYVTLHYCTTASRPASKRLITILQGTGQRFCYFIIDHKGAVILIFSTVPLFFYRYLKISRTKNTIAATYVLFVTIPKAIGKRADNTT